MENNKLIKCECGCGKLRPKYDKKGRRMKFINGHQNRGENNPSKKEWVKKILSDSHKGKKQSEETIRKRVSKISGKNHYLYGKKRSIDVRLKLSKSWKPPKNIKIWKEKISLAVKKAYEEGRKVGFLEGHIPILKNKTLEKVYGEEKAKKIKEKIKQARAKQIIPTKDTSIEVKIQNFLKQLGMEFFTHQYMKIEHGYQCDILIPIMNLVIECDGDFIHCNPKMYSSNFVRYPSGKKIITAKEIWERDRIRTQELIEKGFKVLRLWGSEIKDMDLDGFEGKIKYV